MIPRIKNKGVVPRGGWWRYTQPETGERIVNGDWDTFIGLIKQHRKRKGIPIGLGFEREIEDYICEHQSEMCEDADPMIPRVGKLSMGDIVRGMRVIASFKAQGSPLVPKEEAYRRAAICARCRFNVMFSRPCGGLCPELKSLVKAVIGNEKTPFDDDLRSCGICSCYTQSHVWLPLDILDKGLTDEMRAQFRWAKDAVGCWKITQL